MATGVSKANDPFTQSKKDTFDGFMRLAMRGTVFVILLLIAMAIFLL